MGQPSVEKTRALQECQRHKLQTTDRLSILSLLLGILARSMFVERWTGVLQVQFRFQNTQ